jgi:hypothetical protein
MSATFVMLFSGHSGNVDIFMAGFLGVDEFLTIADTKAQSGELRNNALLITASITSTGLSAWERPDYPETCLGELARITFGEVGWRECQPVIPKRAKH